MRHVVYLTPARRDISSIYNYVVDASGSAAVARRMIQRITSACSKLGELPGTLGTQRAELGDGLRSTPCDNYVIFFRYQPERIEIVTVLHASRDIDGYFSAD